MLVTGSNVGWLINVIDKHLEAGRLQNITMSPYLSPIAGILAVYRYSRHYRVPIVNEAALLINKLSYSDPYFIACVMRSRFPGKNLTTRKGVLDTVRYEASDPKSELAGGWLRFFDMTLDKVNQKNAKKILLFLTKNPQKGWRAAELKKELNLNLEVSDIQKELEILREADLIWGVRSLLRYYGNQDGTFYLILREIFKYDFELYEIELEKGLSYRLAELEKENRSLQSALNNSAGHTAELQLGMDMLNRSQFSLSAYFSGLDEKETLSEWKIENIHNRYSISHPVDTNNRLWRQVDLKVDFAEEKFLLVEVKKHKKKIGPTEIEEFWEKVELFRQQNPGKQVSAAFLSLGGFSENALKACKERGIGTANQINYIQTEWSK